MRRYFIYLAYNGENYFGWQTQPNGETVQEAIEKALSTLLRTPISILGAGRTDSGVHAKSMIAHFDCDIDDLNIEELVFKLNNFLNRDIVIYNIIPVRNDAHARFDAIARTYKYYVTTKKDPFLHKLKYKVHGDLNLEMMNECANVLFDYIDFTSFSKLHSDVKTNNCTIMHAEWVLEGDDYIFTIKANRFLRNMVRAIVGTLLLAGQGKLTPNDMRTIIEAKDRSKAGTSAPAHALFLEEVEYPKEIFQI